jgi:hypothetical protein
LAIRCREGCGAPAGSQLDHDRNGFSVVLNSGIVSCSVSMRHRYTPSGTSALSYRL